jgi:NADH-quinone oxidoreductase subunit N
MFSVLGMMIMISANDLISLYVGLELQSLVLYVLAAFRRDDVKSSEAGLKYFVLGALSSGMLLYGASLIYGFAGTTNFTVLAQEMSKISTLSIGFLTGMVFVICGLAFKISAVPFHMWTPDVYEGAPTPVTAFFALAPKVAAMALFVRFLAYPLNGRWDLWGDIISVLAAASLIVGAVAALRQTNIKRLLAYSSIGHMGFVLLGIAAGNNQGIQGIVLYLAIYVLMSAGTFACVLAMRRQGQLVENISDLAGLSKTHPWMALMLLILMFSMAGIPPFAGFFAKLYVLLPAIQAHLYLLSVIAVLSSVVSAYYYLRIVKLMYFDVPMQPLDKGMDSELSFIMTACSFIISGFVLFPDWWIQWADRASSLIYAAQ